MRRTMAQLVFEKAWVPAGGLLYPRIIRQLCAPCPDSEHVERVRERHFVIGNPLWGTKPHACAQRAVEPYGFAKGKSTAIDSWR